MRKELLNSVVLPIWIVVFSGFISTKAFSQTDCVFALDNAQNSYDQGVFQNIPELLLPCMEKGFSKDEKLRAYKLLILTYLFDDKQDKAEDLMLEFLNKYPEYEITPADPIEFEHLFENYETVPVYSFGLILGGNFTDAIITEPYGVSNLDNYNGNYTPSGMGFQLGFRINRHLQDNLEINGEIHFTQNALQFTSSEYDFLDVTVKETFTNLAVPLSVTYDFPLGTLTPYGRAGFSFDYLFQSSGIFRRTYSENIGLTDVTGPEIELTPSRKEYYLSFLLGGGVKYNMSNGYLVFDLRTNIGMYNFINTDNRYAAESTEPLYKYFYIDDDLIVNRMFFSVGYVRKLYKTFRK